MILLAALTDDESAALPVALFTGPGECPGQPVEVVLTKAGPVALVPAALFLQDAPPEFLVRLLARAPGTVTEPDYCWHLDVDRPGPARRRLRGRCEPVVPL